MNNFVSKRGKEIIICLLIVILILVILLLKPNSSTGKNEVYGSKDPISQAKLDNFKKLLLDPKQNVHAVALLAPNRDGKLVILNNSLDPIEPCFKSDENIKPGDKIEIPQECTEGKIRVEEGKDQIIALTPGANIEGYSNENSLKADGKNKVTWLFITDFDKTVHRGCHNSDGYPCPPQH